MSRIYLSPPDVRHLERELLLAAMDSGWAAPAGPDLAAFERDTAQVCCVAQAVALSSGTAALHLALHQLGVSSGDSVLVSTFTFAASANAVKYVGADPVFVDSDPATWNLSPDLVAEELTTGARTGSLPKAAVIVDLYGQCADYDRLRPLFAEYGIPVIEDAAEALGATYRGRPAGSLGDVGVLSFNGNKVITTSGGGMLLCDDERFARRIRNLATQARAPAPHYEHVEVGFNYRLSNLLAAFGRGQLATLHERIDRRRYINECYSAALANVAGVEFMPVASYSQPNWWLTCITVDPDTAVFSAEELRFHLEAADIESRPTWKPMHLQPVFIDAPARVDGTSETLFHRGLCLPSGSAMTDAELERVIDRIIELAER
jgi:pyridoxal phosphate-dependent aminotransferase EpsN